jgi:hypothetical protein
MNTCAKAGSSAQRSISATAASAFSFGSTMADLSRGSGLVNASRCQSLTADVSAAEKSPLSSLWPDRPSGPRMPYSMP